MEAMLNYIRNNEHLIFMKTTTWQVKKNCENENHPAIYAVL